MAKKQTVALGVSQYELVPVDDMTAGVDLRHTPTLVQPPRARLSRNVSISEPGVWRPYPGWVQFSVEPLE